MTEWGNRLITGPALGINNTAKPRLSDLVPDTMLTIFKMVTVFSVMHRLPCDTYGASSRPIVVSKV